MKPTKESTLKDYNAGSTIAAIAEKHGCSRQYIHQLLKQNPSYAKLSHRRKKRNPKTINVFFGGKKYFLRSDGYYISTDSSQTPLHRAVYIHYKGLLSPTQDVHHIDGDKSNNTPENLIAIGKSDHGKGHGSAGGKISRRKITPEEQAKLQAARAAARAKKEKKQ
jgi:hypothetical protein